MQGTPLTSGIKMTGEDDYREMPLKAISREIKFRQDVMRK